MMENGASASQKHAKSKLVSQLEGYLQSFWHTIPQHTPWSCGWNSIGRCVMIFCGGGDILSHKLPLMRRTLTMDSISFSRSLPERTSIYWTFLQTSLTLWETATKYRIVTTAQ